MTAIYEKLSGNPESETPTKIVHQLRRLAKYFDSEEFKSAFEALDPDYLCPCCVQSLLEDAAEMVSAYAGTPEGKELDE